MMLQPDEISQTGCIIGHSLNPMTPYDAAVLLNGTIANLVGHVDEELWIKMKAEADRPCGKENCNCQAIAQGVFKALDLLREDWKKAIAGEGHEEKGFPA